MQEDILSRVYKPGRYLGNEWGVVKKDLRAVALRFALCFPEVYELGMSHLGYRIIYHLLNSQDDIACERAFAPGNDLDEILRARGLPLTSLESDLPLNEFDVLGFSLVYELSFLNCLNILDLCAIPLKTRQRNETHPLVIAGGYACVNPEPMAEFFDCFLVGEGEELVVEVAREIKCALKAKIGREGLKRRLANIEGVYAPELYRIEYFHQGEISLFAPVDKGVPARVRRRVAPDLDSAFFPEQWLVPYIRLVHDRLILEIMRGCPHSCRFCQARVVYRPWRRRSAERIIGLAKDLLPASGYGEISLLGLSCGDHPQLSQIISRIITLYRDKGINLSLPSLRIRDYLGDIPSLLGQMKKTGLTFAPEAASGRLRKIINKEMDTQQLFDVVAKAYRVGYRHIKLYFMIGLPGEIAQDLREIADMAVSLAEMRRRIDGRPGRVTLSISAFSPKPHTEFERLAMDDIETLARKQKYIRSCFRGRRRGIKIDFSDAHTAFLETVLSRADRRVCGVIEEAFRLRAGRNFGLWLRAFEARGVNPYFYVNREFSRGEILPWGHIDVGKKNIA